MAYLGKNGTPRVSPGIESNNAIVEQFVEEFSQTQSRLDGLYNTMIESIPGVEHDEMMNVYISECISLLALCEKQCMGYYMV